MMMTREGSLQGMVIGGLGEPAIELKAQDVIVLSGSKKRGRENLRVNM